MTLLSDALSIYGKISSLANFEPVWKLCYHDVVLSYALVVELEYKYKNNLLSLRFFSFACHNHLLIQICLPPITFMGVPSQIYDFLRDNTWTLRTMGAGRNDLNMWRTLPLLLPTICV